MAKFPLHSPSLILAQFMIIFISLLQFPHNPNADDLTALLDFKNRITDDPLQIMASWNHSLHHYCNWTGITCNPSNQRVRILNLMSQKLVGSLPPSLSNLTSLHSINLRFNSFNGQMPREIGLLSNLKHLNLTNNMLSGSIPSTLGNCTQLTTLALDYNQLTGKIPIQLGSLLNLQIFGVGVNNITDTFPVWIGNMSSLRFSRLSLALNAFHGGIPHEIGRLTGLTFFQVYGNRFSGELPSSVYNISSMNYFSVTQNRLQGKIPQDVGLKFPNIEFFAFGVNDFSGEIPASLANASRIKYIELSWNSLTGNVPSTYGRLQFLEWFNLENNLLGNGYDLSFISSLTNCTNLRALGLLWNEFGGELPKTIANLSRKIEGLTFGENHLHGNIPYGIGGLENLTYLSLETNRFTGSIPEDIGKLQRLNKFHLRENVMTGMIPSSLGNMTSLIELYLDSNMLQGSIPPHLGNCSRLLHLNVSSNNLTGGIPKEVMSLSSLSVILGLGHNFFSGRLPDEVGKLVNLKELDVSGNKLSGPIPSTLSSCLSLEVLIMGGNRFEGTIPESLEGLRGLQEIDFSHNNLSGKIPQFFGKLPFITKLDLSYNNFEGEVLKEGILTNATAISLVGNKQLCGGAPSLNLPPCSVPARKSNKNLKLIRWLIPVIVAVALGVVLIYSYGLWCILRKTKREQHNTASSVSDLQYLVVSYHDLHRATDGFSAANLIGSGSFGSVYRGILGDNDTPVAVKVLNLEQKGAINSFLHECAVLRSVRHRNLLKIVTVCSGFDPQGQDFKSVVTELMANGSLDVWLHPRRMFPTRTLNMKERLNIAIDVASALDYLHNHGHTPIVHCDLKPSNILLDEDLTARVGDFGLAKILMQSANISHSQKHSLSVELRGSIGYIPPEYGTSTHISTLGDVYSYGILVLELFTGKRPTDDMFNDELSIQKYVARAMAMALPEHAVEVLDPSLILGEEAVERDTDEGSLEGRDKVELQQLHSGEMDCLISILRVGLSCSLASPEDRMSITSVVNQLRAITVPHRPPN